MNRVLPSHERGSGRRADGRHVVVLQHEAGPGQRVDVRRGDLVRPVEAHVIPALRLDTEQTFRSR